MLGMVLRFLVTAAALPACSLFMPGVTVADYGRALLVGAALGLVYLLLRPVARLLLKVLNWLTLGLLYVAVDAWLVWAVVENTDGGVALESFWWAAAVALVVNVARTLIDLVSRGFR